VASFAIGSPSVGIGSGREVDLRAEGSARGFDSRHLHPYDAQPGNGVGIPKQRLRTWYHSAWPGLWFGNFPL
jgi:hypothetical protein